MRLLQKADQLVADGGYGHTSSLYVHPVRDREDREACSSNEDLPYSDQYTFFTRWYRRPLQLQDLLRLLHLDVAHGVETLYQRT